MAPLKTRNTNRRTWAPAAFALLLSTQATAGDALCPQATQRLARAVQYGNLHERVAAPDSPEEAQKRLAELDTSSGDRRTAAVMALGLGGNLEAFDRFIAARARDDLFIYASSYLNADGTVCVDPAVERALIEHLGSPELDRGLLGFLYKNRYRSRELLAVLVAVPMDQERPRDYVPRARAMVATNLPGIEPTLLRRALSLPDPTTPALRHVLPDIHRHFIGFFAERAYAPALDYLRQRLTAAERSEADVNLRNANAHTRLAVYRALDAIGAKAAGDLALDELAGLAQASWDGYFVNELHDLGPVALRLANTPARRARVIAALRVILQSPSLPDHPGYVPPVPAPAGHPGYYDYQIRKAVYALLAEAAGADAGDVIADELARVTSSATETNRDALVVELVGTVAKWPADASLNATRLARLSSEIDNEVSAVSLLSALYESRPNAAVVEAILRRLDRLDTTSASNPRLADPLRDGLFALAQRARDPALARALRERMDGQYEDGDILRDEYRRRSLALNELLGDESATYRSMEQALKEEQQQAQALERRRKWQQMEDSMARDLAAHSSTDGIRADVAALSRFGSAAKRSAEWLVRVGPKALPIAHAALADPQSNATQRVQLMAVIGEIGDASSVPHIIAATRAAAANGHLYRHAFQALARLPQTPEAVAFADAQLEGDAPATVKRAALTYFALQRDQGARRWAERYARQDVPAEIGVAAAFLAARLDLPGCEGMLRRRLHDESDRTRRSDLLRVLAEVTGPEELAAIASTEGVAASDRELGRLVRYARFRRASGEDRAARAAEVLDDPAPLAAREAARYLIAGGRVDILERWFPVYLPPQAVWQLSPTSRVIEIEAWRMGRRIERSENGIRLVAGG